MKVRSKHAPLFLLLLPTLASAVNPDTIIDADAVPDRRRDAPHDGQDGKPHLGPFVETASSHSSSSSSSGGDQPPLKGRPDDYTMFEGREIPQTNDGVMFDKNRDHALEGTTGTEGGVSAKTRTREVQEDQAGGKSQAQPEAPKEQPPLPHSEEQKIRAAGRDLGSAAAGAEDAESKGYAGLDKSSDLPDTTSRNADAAHYDDIANGHGSLPPGDIPGVDEDDGIIQPFHSFVLSLTMILVSEIGDKTFLVAALMAMKHDRMTVFSAAFSALLVMTVLSAFLGQTVPALIPRHLTSFAAAVLFFVFGGRLLREGMQMDPDEGVGAEMSEVEQELAEKERELGRHGQSTDLHTLEMGLSTRRSRSRSQFPSPPRSPSQSPVRSPTGSGSMKDTIQGVTNLFSLLLSPAWVQTFIMTFLGEWGDRSQIATIAMAAGQDYWWVTLGAMVGHAVCTGAAVIGGRAIAGRVSLKYVTVGGAIAFLVFGVIYLVEALYG
ncbi:GCR1-dependent translation factor-like protein [Hapsidospora chrysogenum ATCC 11550]|uniref:GCR1-dependent translation factor-like protein n=1 Tax=Hapsidospora chrysogenum (strain ATCC 11550 / CBS 779.69 / DSM 880 / IAM 14645 / JCM 23072 / IMI 49137) TaxID=857340 RepID=A0A086TCG1_HAPC1|nr:GCR1-dependent translation factor-like protein [Hapsidospora chrysogenum ATCC 11550]